MSVFCHWINVVLLLFTILYLIIAVVKLSISSKTQITAACVKNPQDFHVRQCRLFLLNCFVYFNESCGLWSLIEKHGIIDVIARAHLVCWRFAAATWHREATLLLELFKWWLLTYIWSNHHGTIYLRVVLSSLLFVEPCQINSISLWDRLFLSIRIFFY